MHAPDRQLSESVHTLPSLHAVPFALFGFEHVPVPVLHTPATWHWSRAVHVTGLAPEHVPDWQVSVWVHPLPSLHAVPFAAIGFEHVPVATLHTPATWHESLAVHTTAVPVHAPD